MTITQAVAYALEEPEPLRPRQYAMAPHPMISPNASTKWQNSSRKDSATKTLRHGWSSPGGQPKAMSGIS